jgi:hypothetical protein
VASRLYFSLSLLFMYKRTSSSRLMLVMTVEWNGIKMESILATTLHNATQVM